MLTPFASLFHLGYSRFLRQVDRHVDSFNSLYMSSWVISFHLARSVLDSLCVFLFHLLCFIPLPDASFTHRYTKRRTKPSLKLFPSNSYFSFVYCIPEKETKQSIDLGLNQSKMPLQRKIVQCFLFASASN